MQNGCLMQVPRRRGPNVWEFRWREPGSDGRRVHRRIVVGTVQQLRDETRAVRAILGLRREINSPNALLTPRLLTIAQLVEHYKQRELALDNTWKTYSTKATYRGYLRKWIVPRWGTYTLASIRPIEVEHWLRNLVLARASCAKIRNLMSVLFNTHEDTTSLLAIRSAWSARALSAGKSPRCSEWTNSDGCFRRLIRGNGRSC